MSSLMSNVTSAFFPTILLDFTTPPSMPLIVTFDWSGRFTTVAKSTFMVQPLRNVCALGSFVGDSDAQPDTADVSTIASAAATARIPLVRIMACPRSSPAPTG
jgi:hypothetical protein